MSNEWLFELLEEDFIRPSELALPRRRGAGDARSDIIQYVRAGEIGVYRQVESNYELLQRDEALSVLERSSTWDWNLPSDIASTYWLGLTTLRPNKE